MGSQGINPNYFLDDMNIFEVEMILKSYSESIKNSWSQTRWLAAIFANAFSKQTIQPTDLLKFEWEQNTQKNDIQLTTEYREKMQKKMLEMCNR